MKTLLFLLLTASIVPAGISAEMTPQPSHTDVTVERLTLNLPSDDRAAAQTLWRSFSNQPAERKFTVVPVHDCRRVYPKYVDELVRRAANAKLESDSLQRILNAIDQKRGSLAVLPVGAYRATQGTKAIWIVVCKWEIESAGSNPDIRLGHVRMFAYDVATIEQVAFKTCM
jgi:hypothetical protein